jgi:hypothetical protein
MKYFEIWDDTDTTRKAQLQEEVIKYDCKDKISDVDTSSLTVDNVDGSYTDLFEEDDIWRFFNIDGSLLMSGLLIRDPKGFEEISLEGEGWTTIANRPKAINERYYDRKSGSILTNSTDGLIKKYINTDYGTIDLSSDVVTPDNNLEINFNNQTLISAMKDLGDSSYKGTNFGYDFGFYEPTAGDLRLWYQPAGYPTATLKLFEDDLIVSRSQKERIMTDYTDFYNSVRVVGKLLSSRLVPNDGDDWTEGTTLPTGWSNVVNTTVTINGSLKYIGDQSVRIEVVTPGSAAYAKFDRTDDLVKDKAHSLRFWVRASRSSGVNLEKFKIILRVKDKYGNATVTASDLQREYLVLADSGNPPFYYFEVPLPQKEDYKSWFYDSTSTFPSSGLPTTEWETIDYIGFFLEDTSNIDFLFIDGLSFIVYEEYEGTYPTTTPSKLKQYQFINRGLPSNQECQDFAQRLYNFLNTANFSGTFQTNHHFDIGAGDTINLDLYTLNLKLNKVRVKQVRYTKTNKTERQYITLGYDTDIVEKIKELNKKGEEKNTINV